MVTRASRLTGALDWRKVFLSLLCPPTNVKLFCTDFFLRTQKSCTPVGFQTSSRRAHVLTEHKSPSVRQLQRRAVATSAFCPVFLPKCGRRRGRSAGVRWRFSSGGQLLLGKHKRETAFFWLTWTSTSSVRRAGVELLLKLSSDFSYFTDYLQHFDMLSVHPNNLLYLQYVFKLRPQYDMHRAWSLSIDDVQSSFLFKQLSSSWGLRDVRRVRRAGSSGHRRAPSWPSPALSCSVFWSSDPPAVNKTARWEQGRLPFAFSLGLPSSVCFTDKMSHYPSAEI